MKNLKSTLNFFLTLSFLSVITYACCDELNWRMVGSGYHNTYDINTAQNFTTEEKALITGPFTVIINQITESTTALHHLSFSQASYATSCPQNFVNSVIPESLNMYLNKSFIYQGDTIVPGTEIKGLSGLTTEIYWSEINLYFKDSLMEQLEFSNEEYLLTVKAQTDDGLSFQNDIRLEFNIN